MKNPGNSQNAWSGLAVLWSIYCGSVLTIGRFQQWTRIVIWVGAAIVIAKTIPLLVQKTKDIPTEASRMAAFTGWCLLGLLNVVDAGAYLNYLKLIVELLLLIVCFSTAIRNSETTDSLWWAFMVSAVFNVLYIVFAGSQSVRFVTDDGVVRASGLMLNPNAMGYISVFGIIGAMTVFGTSRTLALRVVCSVCGAILGMGIFATVSRGAFVVFAVAAVLWPFALGLYTRKNAASALSLTLILGVLFYWGAHSVLSNTHLGTRLAQSSGDRLMHEKRYDLVLVGLRMVARHPLIGVGLGQFGKASGTGSYAHNDWLEVASTTGIPGWIIYVSIYFAAWQRMSRALPFIRERHDRYRVNMARILLVALLVAGIFSPNFISFESMFGIAFVVGMGHWAERKRAEMLFLHRHSAFVSPFRQRTLIRSTQWRAERARRDGQRHSAARGVNRQAARTERS
jgi:O-antigen ligase